MDRRAFISGITLGLLAAPLAAEAQQAAKIYRIGLILTGTPTETGHLIKALSDGLRELGYVEGRNVVFEKRFAEGRQERLPPLAAERSSSRALHGLAQTSPGWPTTRLPKSSERIWRF